MNWVKRTPVIAAIGLATVPSPGTNGAISKAVGPWRPSAFSVRRMQASGSSAIRHSSASTFRPPRRPASYQIPSETSAAMSETEKAVVRLTCPDRARAPAVTRNGIAGSGSPS